MRKKLLSTTFRKMTMIYVVFGVLPLFFLSILFFSRFTATIRQTMISNYAQIDGYFAKNVEDIIDSADSAMAELYDYETDYGDNLTIVLKNDTLSTGQKAVAVTGALNQVMSQSEYISSTRFVDYKGKIYSVYYNQDKILRNDADYYTQMSIINSDEIRSLRILGATEESKICINSDDFIVVLVRNYMDTTAMNRTYDTALGTLFVDLNVNVFDELVEKINVENGCFYICNPEESQYVYSEKREDFCDGRNPLGEEVLSKLTDQEGHMKIDGNWIFYKKILNTDHYAVLSVSTVEALGYYFSNRTMMIVILLFAMIFLILLYILFSNKMLEPIHALCAAMKKVEDGDMDCHVELNTQDEMEMIADGFNTMVERLQDYINQVYVARICQKDAELNALKMQIQPHYLYNTLDVIRMTALEEKDEKTAELLECLAHQLRYVMGEHTDCIVLRDELQALREYFVIMRVRYEGRIGLNIQVSDEDAQLFIPKLLLQPVVENAIRHGLRDKAGEGTVAIRVERKEDHLEIVVMDDGVGMNEEQVRIMQETLDHPEIGKTDVNGRLSVGMKNVYDRIKLNCGKEYGFRIESFLGVGTIVTYHLPIWEGPEDVESSDRG